MLYWLGYEVLAKQVSVFRLFQYSTFRTAMASVTAMLISVLLGPWLIGRLRAFQIQQHIREEGPQSHQKKAGTPTMGGLLICAAIIGPTLLWANLHNAAVWVAMASVILFGAIGFWDDYTKVSNKRNLGLTVRRKLALEVFAALVITVMLVAMNHAGVYTMAMNVPFAKNFKPDLVVHSWLNNPVTAPLAYIFFFLFVALVLAGSTEGVNLTDGLDGLAIGLMLITSMALTALSFLSGHAQFSEYLDLARTPGASELTIFCGALAGASLGFLWYNSHPAQVFMGDVGSLALGGAMGTVAVLLKQELLLPLIGGMFALEYLSVIIQVASFRFRNGKRVFKMAPLHHHFEHLGWHESKVIIRFWIAGLVLALFALTTLKLR
jgi:phospho-N-acetylmuramoyl-pentapeptide-transferase